MSDDRGTVRSISWRDLFPWLVIFRTFGVSIAVPVLFLAMLGALLTPVGWQVGEWLFIPKEAKEKVKRKDSEELIKAKKAILAEEEKRAKEAKENGFQEIVRRNSRWAWQRRSETRARKGIDSVVEAASAQADHIPAVFREFVDPYRQLSQTGLSFTRLAYFLFGGLWTLLVWAFFGGAITRLAAMQLGCEQRIGLKEALQHATRKVVQYFLAPLAPLLLVALITLPMILLGWFMWVGDWGVVLAGIAWPLVILGSFISIVLLLGLLFGWPLMWGTISSEGTDAFDALSRSYAYTFQRPLHYLFYTVVAVLFGLLVTVLVNYFSEAVIYFGEWGVSWSLPKERWDILNGPDSHGRSGAIWAGAGLIEIFNGLVRTVAIAFRYSFFWCAATAVYLLLRKDVDQTELDEIFIEEEDQRYGLPPLATDEKGVPDLADKPSGDDGGGESSPEDGHKSDNNDE